MNRMITLVMAFGLLLSCKNEASPSTHSSPATVSPSTPPPAMTAPSAAPPVEPPAETPAPKEASPTQTGTRLCYLYQGSKDFVLLKITLAGADATGTLEYRENGKVLRTGDIRGQVQGDVLYGQYTYTSDGKTLIREVAFKLTAQEAREGQGETWELGGRTLFKNRNGLNYNSSLVMTSVTCP